MRNTTGITLNFEHIHLFMFSRVASTSERTTEGYTRTLLPLRRTSYKTSSSYYIQNSSLFEFVTQTIYTGFEKMNTYVMEPTCVKKFNAMKQRQL